MVGGLECFGCRAVVLGGWETRKVPVVFRCSHRKGGGWKMLEAHFCLEKLSGKFGDTLYFLGKYIIKWLLEEQIR